MSYEKLNFHDVKKNKPISLQLCSHSVVNWDSKQEKKQQTLVRHTRKTTHPIPITGQRKLPSGQIEMILRNNNIYPKTCVSYKTLWQKIW